MPLISDPSNTRSVFPTGGIDVYPNQHDGTGVDSVIDAEIWDRIESAIYKTQTYSRGLLHLSGTGNTAGSMYRITVAVTGTVSSSGLIVNLDVPFSATQMATIANSSFNFSSVYGHVYNLTGSSAQYLVYVSPINGTTIRLQFRNMDLTTPVPVGPYAACATIIGF